jgi:hypothetical protein
MHFEGFETVREIARTHKEDFEGLEPAIDEGELRELCEGDAELESLLESMLEYSVRYAVDVWNMQKFIHEGGFNEDPEEFKRIDDARTRLHTALVDSIGILSRALTKKEKNNEWVRDLTQGVGLDRAACGAFALLITYRRYLDTN